MNTTIRIALVEDHLMFRQGLKLILEGMDGFSVVYETDQGEEMEKDYDPEKIDLILLDLRLKGQSGTTTCKNLFKSYPGVKIIILSQYNEPELFLESIHNGASSYVCKSEGLEKIEKAIREVVGNGFYFDEDIGALLRMEMAKAHKFKFGANGEEALFNKVELEIATLHCKQLGNTEISELMRISERAVVKYKANMVDKTHSRNFTGVIIYLFRHRYLFVEDMNIGLNIGA